VVGFKRHSSGCGQSGWRTLTGKGVSTLMFISKSEKKAFKQRIEHLEADRWAGRKMTCEDAAKLSADISLLFAYLNVEKHHTYPKTELKKRKGK